MPRAVSRSSSAPNILPSLAASLTGIDDLGDLPKSLLIYIISIEERLFEIEDMLQGLLAEAQDLSPASATSAALPTSAALLTATPIAGGASPTFFSGVTETFSTEPSASSSEDLCNYPGLHSPVPCTSTFLSHSTITRTALSTHFITATLELASSTAGSVPPYSNISIAQPPQATAYPPTVPTGLPGSKFTLTRSLSTIASVNPSVSTASSSPLPSYTFHADSRDNLAVYYGSTPATRTDGLLALCERDEVDIVILSFLFTFFTPHGYPSIDFGPGCTGPSARQAQQAPGLQNCSSLAPEITTCQKIGKKVLVSLGGSPGNTTFTSAPQTQQFAATLWSLFGPGMQEDDELRPFGRDVVVDGFDIDNQSGNSSFYQNFAESLRALFEQDTTKTYYLSAAPSCPMPDSSIPFGAMLAADFVWARFYNDSSCELGSDNFRSSFIRWSHNLTQSNQDTPRVYIGAAAWDGGGTGYVQGDALSGPVSDVKQLDLQNMGGMMLWDGSEALANVDQYGDDYLVYAKAALQT